MLRRIKIASLQMDANPAPKPVRLERAEALLSQAAAQGAQLVVLPELFNTGYSYTDENYAHAEPLEGPTHRWMRQLAAYHHLYLAGALLLRDAIDIYDSFLLIAPQGHTWRYDKSHPCGWEQAYFRAGRGSFVADTPLGRIGMLIGWDASHTELWQAYAGKVDLMLISSSLLDITNPLYTFPDGSRLTLSEISPFLSSRFSNSSLVFDRMLAEQTAWLGISTVNAMGCGEITTPIPRPRDLLLAFLPFRLRMWKHLRQASSLRMTCSLLPGTKILAAGGQILAELSSDSAEGFAIAEVTLPDQTFISSKPQPPTPLPSIAGILFDQVIPGLMQGEYKHSRTRLNSNSLR